MSTSFPRHRLSCRASALPQGPTSSGCWLPAAGCRLRSPSAPSALSAASHSECPSPIRVIRAIRGFHSESAFNLIEVTLAVAVVAVGLLAIMGLLPTAIQSSKTVSDETVITQLAWDLFSLRRTVPFDQPVQMWPGTNTTAVVVLPALSNTGTASACFDQNGNPTIAPTNCYFRVRADVQQNPNLLSTAPGLARLVLTAEWPVSPTVAKTNDPITANQRIFVTQIARFKAP